MPPAKVLVAYYSRSGTTRRLAALIAQLTGGEIEEIAESGSRNGMFGYLRSLVEVIRQRCPPIKPGARDPSAYRLVVIGTPVWAGSVSSPVRAYLVANRARLPEVAFFCTLGGRGSERAFAQMEGLAGKSPRACCAIRAAQIGSEVAAARVKDFVGRL